MVALPNLVQVFPRLEHLALCLAKCRGNTTDARHRSLPTRPSSASAFKASFNDFASYSEACLVMFLLVICNGSWLNIMLLQILLKKAPLPLHTLEYWKGVSLQLYLLWSPQACQRIYGSSPRPNYHHTFPKGAMHRFSIWVLPLLERPRDFPMGWGAVLQLMADWREGRNTVTWQKNVMDEKKLLLLLCI